MQGSEIRLNISYDTQHGISSQCHADYYNKYKTITSDVDSSYSYISKTFSVTVSAPLWQFSFSLSLSFLPPASSDLH